MSGNASRKYKQYRRMLERRKLFGDIEPKGHNGVVDLVTCGASQGEIITKNSKYDLAKVKPNRRELKALFR